MRLDSLFQDIRYAVRTFRRAPLFAATVAATMGLGLGLLGSAFTLLNAYLLKPIDLPDPYALYSLSWDTDTTQRRQFRIADYEALQREALTLLSSGGRAGCHGHARGRVHARPARDRQLLRAARGAAGPGPIAEAGRRGGPRRRGGRRAVARRLALQIRRGSVDHRSAHLAGTSALRGRRSRGAAGASVRPGDRDLLGTADHGGRVSGCYPFPNPKRRRLLSSGVCDRR